MAVVLVAALVATVHWPVLGARALAFDDGEYVARNPLVTHPGWSSAGRFFAEVLRPSSVRGYYHPLSMTSLMVDFALGGRADDPRVFHRTNLALHVVNAMLIVLVLHRLFGAVAPAALGGLLFGLHPLTVEPVAWIAERKTLLATALALGCVLCYLEHHRRNARAWWVTAVALHGLALLAKPTVTPLPLVLLILDRWPLRRFRLRAVAEKWPFLLLSLLSGAITLVSQRRTTLIEEVDVGLWPLRASHALVFHLRKIAWPAELSCVYEPPRPFTLSHPGVAVGLAAVLGLTVLLVALRRRAPGPLAGWSCFVLALAPTLGLVGYTWMHACDRYAYFPSLGILITVTAGLTAAWGPARGAGWAPRALVLAPVIAVLAFEARGTRATLRHWTDSLTLHRHMARVAPGAPAVHAQLGVHLAEAGARDEALLHFRRAIELAPDYPAAHYNLGLALAAVGRFEESVGHFRAADALLPGDPPTIYSLGQALRLAGRLEEAAAEFRRVLRLDPGHGEAANGLGEVLIVLGRAPEAVHPLRAALANAPPSAALHYRLAGALALGGGPAAEVRDHLRKAMELDPRWPQPVNDLAWLLATSPDSAVRDPTEALRLAERAVALTGGRHPAVLDTRAAAEAASGRFEDAIRTEREAMELAIRSGRDTLRASMGERLNLYRRRIPYVKRGQDGAATGRRGGGS